MEQHKEAIADEQARQDGMVSAQPAHAHTPISKKVSDHLANERTFLAWVRTGIAVIGLGFVIERFGLFLRELGLKVGIASGSSLHYSKWLGIGVTILGVVLLIVALFNFLHIRRSIDAERYSPGLLFPILLISIASLIGVSLAVYLLLTT
jgi:putative membrane protein